MSDVDKTTLWGRNKHPDSLDALAFLKDIGRPPQRVLDVERQPPDPREWAHISAGLGSLAEAVDQRHPDFRRVFYDFDRLDEKGIAMRLHEHRAFILCPILLTPEGAVAGFRPRAWKQFFRIR